MRAAGLTLIVVLVLQPAVAAAWGPHTEITRAALAVLANKDELARYFGDDWDRIARDYCWTADWRCAVRPDHYPDDYLLFPGVAAHPTHMHPGVRDTYEPYFRRALQAVRTEDPQNAARWIGSLLHFIQDAGSPPHTTGIGGPLHGKMERWVDESKIHIDGYRPRLLGKTDEEALAGLQLRMLRLLEFSRQRAERLRPLVEKLDERASQPLELECALEVARVTADVVYTLTELGLAEPARPGAVLEGTIDFRSPDDYPRVPARIMLAGTSYSTTTGAEGSYRLGHLPPGEYTVLVMATGYQSVALEPLALAEGKSQRRDVKLTADPVAGNLLRNPTAAVHWVDPRRAECWYVDPLDKRRLAAALVRVPLKQRCRMRVEFVPGKCAPLAVRWRSNPAQPIAGHEVPLARDADHATGEATYQWSVVPDARLAPFEKDALYLELLVETDQPLAEVLRHAAVTFEDASDVAR